MTPDRTQGQVMRLVPDLLTQEEAAVLLRLDKLGLRDPTESLRHLRRTRQLGYVKVAGKVLIPRSAVDDYLRRNWVKPAGGFQSGRP